ncbi:MAG: NAD(P)-dependent oxidoreductase, partial [Desulfobacterales bacterium]
MNLSRLLITGSSGRIGSILAAGLSDLFEVFGVDLVASPKMRTFIADISNHEQLSNVLQGIGPLPYIVHLAADRRVDAEWDSVLKNNIIGTRNLYEVARENQVKKIVFASSNHVTGACEGISPTLQKPSGPKTITTRDPVRPDSDYGTSKVFGETVARQYYELYGIHSICLRIGNVLAEDKPGNNERVKKTWLSHRDLVQLFKKSILSNVKFGIYYGVSNNRDRFWDISDAREEIGYYPEDNASN